MLKSILQFILKILAILVLKKYKPLVVGVTGSVGKTSTKEAIYTVLSSKFKVRRNIKNYNNEIGVPLTILGLESGNKNILDWLKNFILAIKTILIKSQYPEILVLEMGADRPGDIKYLTNFVPVDVGVITAIGEIPAHVEFFKTPIQIAREKFYLIQKLPIKSKPPHQKFLDGGKVILNIDDKLIKEMKNKVKAEVLTYGFKEEADLRATDVIFTNHELPGLSFKLNFKGNVVPVRLPGILGIHQIYAILAGAAVGLVFDFNLIEIVEALSKFQPLAGRMRLIPGIKNTKIIDDTYNASPSATLRALETLEKLEANRKIVVLGDMLELGEYTEIAHRQIGQKVKEVADLLFLVGERVIFTADEAERQGFDKSKIFQFPTSDEAKKVVQEKIEEGDLILVKGSQAMRMEKIVEEIMAEPEKAKELLVRQDKSWLEKR